MKDIDIRREATDDLRSQSCLPVLRDTHYIIRCTPCLIHAHGFFLSCYSPFFHTAPLFIYRNPSWRGLSLRLPLCLNNHPYHCRCPRPFTAVAEPPVSVYLSRRACNPTLCYTYQGASAQTKKKQQ